MTTEETTGQQLRPIQYFSFLNDKHIIIVAILMVMAAEMLLYSFQLKAGITLHMFTLLLLAFSTIWISESHVSRSLQVLMLLPVLRLLNISMPVFSEMTLDLYVYIYSPMLLSAYVVIRHQRPDLSGIGFTARNFLKYLPASILVGAFIAIGEHSIINAGSLISDLSFGSVLKLSIVMIFFVGFVEELVFRSLLQTRMEDSFGSFRGLLIASLLFGFMHSGYGTSYEMLFTFLAGLILGYMFQKTRSLPLISLTHGIVNILLFGFIPLVW